MESDRFYFENANVHANAVSSPKQIILHRYRNEINTENKLQLNYSTKIHLLIPRFMKSLCVITIKINTLTDVPYQMTVGGAFVYVFKKPVKEVALNNGLVYITRSVIMLFFPVDPDGRIIMESNV